MEIGSLKERVLLKEIGSLKETGSLNEIESLEKRVLLKEIGSPKEIGSLEKIREYTEGDRRVHVRCLKERVLIIYDPSIGPIVKGSRSLVLINIPRSPHFPA